MMMQLNQDPIIPLHDENTSHIRSTTTIARPAATSCTPSHRTQCKHRDDGNYHELMKKMARLHAEEEIIKPIESTDESVTKSPTADHSEKKKKKHRKREHHHNDNKDGSTKKRFKYTVKMFELFGPDSDTEQDGNEKIKERRQSFPMIISRVPDKITKKRKSAGDANQSSPKKQSIARENKTKEPSLSTRELVAHQAKTKIASVSETPNSCTERAVTCAQPETSVSHLVKSSENAVAVVEIKSEIIDLTWDDFGSDPMDLVKKEETAVAKVEVNTTEQQIEAIEPERQIERSPSPDRLVLDLGKTPEPDCAVAPNPAAEPPPSQVSALTTVDVDWFASESLPPPMARITPRIQPAVPLEMVPAQPTVTYELHSLPQPTQAATAPVCRSPPTEEVATAPVCDTSPTEAANDPLALRPMRLQIDHCAKITYNFVYSFLRLYLTSKDLSEQGLGRHKVYDQARKRHEQFIFYNTYYVPTATQLSNELMTTFGRYAMDWKDFNFNWVLDYSVTMFASQDNDMALTFPVSRRTVAQTLGTLLVFFRGQPKNFAAKFYEISLHAYNKVKEKTRTGHQELIEKETMKELERKEEIKRAEELRQQQELQEQKQQKLLQQKELERKEEMKRAEVLRQQQLQQQLLSQQQQLQHHQQYLQQQRQHQQKLQQKELEKKLDMKRAQELRQHMERQQQQHLLQQQQQQKQQYEDCRKWNMLRMQHEKQKVMQDMLQFAQPNLSQTIRGMFQQKNLFRANTTPPMSTEWRPSTPPTFSHLWTKDECKNAFTPELMVQFKEQLRQYFALFTMPRRRSKSKSPKSDKIPKLRQVRRKSSTHDQVLPSVVPSLSTDQVLLPSVVPSLSTGHPITCSLLHNAGGSIRVREPQAINSNLMPTSLVTRSPPVLSIPEIPNQPADAAAPVAKKSVPTETNATSMVARFDVPISPNGTTAATVTVLPSTPSCKQQQQQQQQQQKQIPRNTPSTSPASSSASTLDMPCLDIPESSGMIVTTERRRSSTESSPEAGTDLQDKPEKVPKTVGEGCRLASELDFIDLTWIDDLSTDEGAVPCKVELFDFKTESTEEEESQQQTAAAKQATAAPSATERAEEQPAAAVRAPSAGSVFSNDSGWGSPSHQEAQGDYTCLCGNPAVYVCACNQATYCSDKCQISDWPDHKKLCGKHFLSPSL